ncbi:MAG: hypothetical protein UMR38_03070 [Candidatus Izemoplasma sp.]|nr:hypothetical protein [Candidatus Izemoplasma sp.]
MKKIIALSILLFSIFSISTETTQADFGPKTSVTVTIVGVDVAYSFDLLIEYGNDDLFEVDDYQFDRYYKETFPEELITYHEDGFASYFLYYGIPSNIDQVDEHTFNMSYIAPSSFKIVIVTETGNIITSEFITKSTFDSDITWDLSGVDLTTSQNDVGILSGNIDDQDNQFWTLTTQVIYRIIGTLIVELGLLFLFMYRKKHTFKIVTITNIITQLVLSIFTVNAYIYGGSLVFLFALLFGEFIVISAEAIIYLMTFKEKPKWLSIIYVLLANILSLIISVVLTGAI